MLLVGRHSDGAYKLPSRELFTSNTRQNSTEFDLPTEIEKLTEFLFYGEINPSRVVLSGLIRHKADNQVLICPVVAGLESEHDKTELVQNPKWINHSRNPDFWWLSEHEITNIVKNPDNTNITHNTRTIIGHSRSTVVSA